MAFLAEALATAGLPVALAEHAEDDSHDAYLRAETELALSRTGPDVGTPILTFAPGQGEREGSFFGPVISKAPRGAEAVKLWTAVETLATSGVAELKRSLRAKPDFDVTPGASGTHCARGSARTARRRFAWSGAR